MPAFFKYTKNGRRETNAKRSYAKLNDCVMNRICAKFDDIPRENMNLAGVAPFNYQMLLSSGEYTYHPEAIEIFCEMDKSNVSNLIESTNESNVQTVIQRMGYDAVKENIIDVFTRKYGSLEEVYPSLVQYLFTGDNFAKATHKQMFWRVFGEIAEQILMYNCAHATICDKCGMQFPNWSQHDCPKKISGFRQCLDCKEWFVFKGPKQIRCEECQKKYRETYVRTKRKSYYTAKKK